MKYTLKNPPPPPTIDAVQHTAGSATESWVKEMLKSDSAPGFAEEWKDDSVDVPTPAGPKNVLQNDAYITYDGTSFDVKDKVTFEGTYTPATDPNAGAAPQG